MKQHIVISTLILLIIQSIAGAVIRPVPSQYPTIQEAIKASENGDEVVVAPGTYSGPGNVDLDFKGKAIIVKSQMDKDNPKPDVRANTIIDCNGTKYEPHRAFHFSNGEGAESVVLGFTIINGYERDLKGDDGRYAANPPVPYESIEEDPNGIPRAERGADKSGDSYGGGILCENESSPTIKYCIISNCTVAGALGGDGADGQDGTWAYQPPDPQDPNLPDPNVDPTEVLDGQWGGFGGTGIGSGYGGAICCVNHSSPVIEDCIIKDNTARGGLGGAGGAGGNGATETDIVGNGGDGGVGIGDGFGGGLYAHSYSYPEVVDTTFTNNVAIEGQGGAGGSMGEEGSTSDDPPSTNGDPNGSFPSAPPAMAGGAAYFDELTDANFIDCVFRNSYAGWGGGPTTPPNYTEGGALYSVSNNVLYLESCEFEQNRGGAVYCDTGCNLTVEDCNFVSNTFGSNTDTSGGAINIGVNGFLDVNESDFFRNTADEGGALNLDCDSVFTNCTFAKNRALDGDGGAIEGYEEGHKLDINFELCTFSDNKALYGWGGSLHFQDFNSIFTNCYFLKNRAQHGGGLFLTGGTVEMLGGIISENQASDDNGFGGGLALVNTAADIQDYTIKNNAATGQNSRGGGIDFYTGFVDHSLMNCLITGNSATTYGGGICSELFAEPAIQNCTFSGNSAGTGGAIYSFWDCATDVNDCIINDSNGIAIGDDDPCGTSINHCLFDGNLNGDYGYWSYSQGEYVSYEGEVELNVLPNVDTAFEGDPLFVSGDLGKFYLSQVAAGQPGNSPAVNNGSVSASSLGLNEYTTRSDGVLDTDMVDIGFHYPDPALLPQRELTVTVIGGHGTAMPTSPAWVDYNPSTGVYSYAAGTLVTLTAEPNTGYRVESWAGGTVDDSSRAKTNYVIMNFDRDIRVTFDQPRVLVVGSDPNYTTIQHTIDAAGEGDTVIIPTDEYDPATPGGIGTIYVSEAITLTSFDPNDPDCVANTVLHNYRLDVEYDSDDYAGVVQGLTFEGGGSGINIDNCSPIVRYCNFINCGFVGVTWLPFDGCSLDGLNGGSVDGGAMDVITGSPTISNCNFENCSVTGGDGAPGTAACGPGDPHGGDGGWAGGAYGGAIYSNQDSHLTVKNCSFINCSAVGGDGGDGGPGSTDPAGHGGRGGNWEWAPSIETGAFTSPDWWWWDGWSYGPYLDYWKYSGYGGAVYFDNSSSAIFTDCEFTSCFTDGGVCGDGGATYIVPPNDTPNRPLDIESFGGAVYAGKDCSVTFLGCEFSDNSSDMSTVDLPDDVIVSYGGTVCSEQSSLLKFTNCAIDGGSACVGGNVYCSESQVVISGSEFSNGSSYYGAGLYTLETNGEITDTNFVGNMATAQPNLPGYEIFGHGGGYGCFSSDVNISNSYFNSNIAYASGGAIYYGGSDQDKYRAPELFNSLVTNNTAGKDGGGISANWYCEPQLKICTIADNVVTGDVGANPGRGGGLSCGYNSHTTIENCIFWGNQAENGPQLSVGIEIVDPEISVDFSDIQGGEAGVYQAGQTSILTWHPTNINSDPLFVNGYYLSQMVAGQLEDSPCVDAGSDLASVFGLERYTTRTDNVPDRFDSKVDIGYHYEMGPVPITSLSPDINLDGVVDLLDLAIIVEYWLDQECDMDNWCEGADVDFDLDVDFVDYDFFASSYAPAPPEMNAPTPDPAEWLVEPYESSDYIISMTAVEATDESGPVEYYFDCTSGAGTDSGWQSEPNYVDDVTLTGDGTYCYTVEVRDIFDNVTSASDPCCVVIQNEDHDAPTPNPSEFSVLPYEDFDGGSYYHKMEAVEATDASGVEYYFDRQTGDEDDSGWQTERTYEVPVAGPGIPGMYRVKTRDKSSNQNESAYSDWKIVQF